MALKKIINCIRLHRIKRKCKGDIVLGKISFRRNLSLRVPDSRAVLKIGDGCFFNNDCSVVCRKQITIGSNCLFGEAVKVYDHNHLIEKNGSVSRGEFDSSSIEIGDGCWIGSGVIILPGVCIGAGSIVGANAVVTKDIPAHSVVVAHQDLRIRPITESNNTQVNPQ